MSTRPPLAGWVDLPVDAQFFELVQDAEAVLWQKAEAQLRLEALHRGVVPVRIYRHREPWQWGQVFRVAARMVPL